jgi:hypothetical protein
MSQCTLHNTNSDNNTDNNNSKIFQRQNNKQIKMKGE